MTRFIWGLLLFSVTLGSCTSGSDRTDPAYNNLNSLWHSGHGSKNPNYDRKRQDLPPVDW
jgi:hypothetical protein